MSKQRRHDKPESNNEDMSWELESSLEPGMLRFLAHVIEDGLQARLRTQEDFIRHFSPVDIMLGLADRPDLRANILVPTTGVRPKIAAKKPAESAGMDLQIALDEGEADAELIVSLFHPDDRVRYLDKTRLWNYIIEPKFWTREKGSGDGFDQAKSHVAFILNRAIVDRLLTFRDVVDGISVAKMVQYLPLDQLQTVIEKALTNSHSNKAFTEQDMLQVVPTQTLVDHIPLAIIWENVICPKVAEYNELSSTTNNQANAVNTPSNNGGGRTELHQSDRPGISHGMVENDAVKAETY